jgi:hypothetical protein
MTSLQTIQEALDRQFYWKFRGAGFVAVCGGVTAISGLCTMPNSYPGQKPTYISSNTYDPDHVSPAQDAVNLRNYQLASTSFKAGISGAAILLGAIGLLIYYNRMYDKEYEKRVVRIAPAPVQPAIQPVLTPNQNPQAPTPAVVSAPVQQPVIKQEAKPIEIEEEETSVEYVQPKITPQIPPHLPVKSILKTGASPLVTNRQNIQTPIPLPVPRPQFQQQYHYVSPQFRYNNYSLEMHPRPQYAPRPAVYMPYNSHYGSYALQHVPPYQRA